MAIHCYRRFGARPVSWESRMSSDEAVDLIRGAARVRGVRTAAGAEIGADVVINAAGPHAASVAAWAGFTLPVVPERHCIFTFSCPEVLDFIPLVIDPSGLYVRPEGTDLSRGRAGDAGQRAGSARARRRLCAVRGIHLADPGRTDSRFRADQDDLGVGRSLRDEPLRSERPHRLDTGGRGIDARDRLQRPRNATLSGGRRGVAELITAGRFETLDLSELSPERLVRNEPLVELNIV